MQVVEFPAADVHGNCILDLQQHVPQIQIHHGPVSGDGKFLVVHPVDQ
jgi:hypothetical protein